MATRCGCGSANCSCCIEAGENVTVTGTGNDPNCYRIDVDIPDPGACAAADDSEWGFPCPTSAGSPVVCDDGTLRSEPPYLCVSEFVEPGPLVNVTDELLATGTTLETILPRENRTTVTNPSACRPMMFTVDIGRQIRLLGCLQDNNWQELIAYVLWINNVEYRPYSKIAGIRPVTEAGCQTTSLDQENTNVIPPITVPPGGTLVIDDEYRGRTTPNNGHSDWVDAAVNRRDIRIVGHSCG